MIKFYKFLIIFFLSYSMSNFVFANEKEIKKINQQLESIEGLYKAGAMDEDEYDKIKSRLLIKKKKLENTKIKKIIMTQNLLHYKNK